MDRTDAAVSLEIDAGIAVLTVDSPPVNALSQAVRAGLTVKEVRLLDVFLMASNRVLSREQLLNFSRNDDVSVTDRAIDAQITRLRRKLNDQGNMIESIRGAGYMFTFKVDAV